MYFSTDQDVDQDEKETKGMKFVISSSTLLKHLQQISKNIQNVNGDPLVYAKYKSTALDLTSEQASILNCAYSPISNKELQEQGLKMKVHHDNFKNHIEPLLQRGFWSVQSKTNQPVNTKNTSQQLVVNAYYLFGIKYIPISYCNFE